MQCFRHQETENICNRQLYIWVKSSAKKRMQLVNCKTSYVVSTKFDLSHEGAMVRKVLD